MIKLQYIFWNPNNFIFKIGSISIMWYSLIMLLSFLAAKYIYIYVCKKEKKSIKNINLFILYIIIFSLIGARLGDVLLYNINYYINNPIEVFLPIKIYPKLEFIGYRGLSYHGAIIGSIIGVYLNTNYNDKFKKNKILSISNPIAFALLMGLFVRVGNFINCEIIGIPTKEKYGILFAKEIIKEMKKNSKFIKNVKIGKINIKIKNDKNYQPIIIKVIFRKLKIQKKSIRKFFKKSIKYKLTNNNYINEHIKKKKKEKIFYTIKKEKEYVIKIETLCIPRHPVQLYESISYLMIFIIMFSIWKRRKIKNGIIASVIIITSYWLRFMCEFYKEPFNILFKKNNIIITIGHLLSIITVIIGIAFIIYLYYNKEKINKNEI